MSPGIRTAYKDLLLEQMRAKSRLFCIDADTAAFQSTVGAEFPDRYANLGIAEANAMSAAAAMAASGWVPVLTTMATFSTMRAAEQFKIDVAGNSLPVKIVGTHGGYAAGHLGSTHHALDDLAIVRALPNVTILVASDAGRLSCLLGDALDLPGPVYLRIGRDEDLDLAQAPGPATASVGDALLLRDGTDITIIACGGYPVQIALEASDRLRDEGVDARVIEMHTLAPIDAEAILAAATQTAGIITVEDHRVVGGLSSAVSEVTAAGAPCQVRPVGAPMTTSEKVGNHPALLEAAGITSAAVIEHARSLLSPPCSADRVNVA